MYLCGWSSNLTKPLPVAYTKSLMESQVKQKQLWFDWYLYSKINSKRVRQFNDNEITLTTDYKLVWIKKICFPTEGANRKEVEHTSPLRYKSDLPNTLFLIGNRDGRTRLCQWKEISRPWIWGSQNISPRPGTCFFLKLSDKLKYSYPILTSGLNFINVLRTTFTRVEPKSVKKTVKLSVFLRFWDLPA